MRSRSNPCFLMHTNIIKQKSQRLLMLTRNKRCFRVLLYFFRKNIFSQDWSERVVVLPELSVLITVCGILLVWEIWQPCMMKSIAAACILEHHKIDKLINTIVFNGFTSVIWFHSQVHRGNYTLTPPVNIWHITSSECYLEIQNSSVCSN